MPERNLIIQPQDVQGGNARGRIERRRENPTTEEQLNDLFTIQQTLRQYLPLIEDWAQDLSVGDDARRKRQKKVEKLRFLQDGLAAVESGRFSYAELMQNENIREAQADLKILLRSRNLQRYFSEHEQTNTNESGNWYDGILPSENFDSCYLTPQGMVEASGLLAIDLEQIVGPDTEVQDDLKAVEDFLFDEDTLVKAYKNREQKEGVVSEDVFSLNWIKGKNPEVWASLCRLVRNKKVLLAILGEPQSCTDVDHLTEDAREQRRQEGFAKMQNIIHLALHNSVRALEFRNENLRRDEQAAVNEFYGEELHLEADEMLQAYELRIIGETGMFKEDIKVVKEGVKLLFARTFRLEKIRKYGHWPEFLAAYARLVEGGKLGEESYQEIRMRIMEVADQQIDNAAYFRQVQNEESVGVGNAGRSILQLPDVLSAREKSLMERVSLAYYKLRSLFSRVSSSAEFDNYVGRNAAELKERRSLEVSYQFIDFFQKFQKLYWRNREIIGGYIKMARTTFEPNTHEFLRNFSGWDLKGLEFTGTEQQKMNFNGVNMSRCVLENTRFELCNLTESNMSQSYIMNSQFERCDCSKADFTDINTDPSVHDFHHALQGRPSIENVARIVMKHSEARHAKFSGDLSHSEFVEGCELDNAEFDSADLKETSFLSASMQRVKMREAILGGTKFRGCNTTDADLSQCHLGQTEFTNCTMDRTSFNDSQILRESGESDDVVRDHTVSFHESHGTNMLLVRADLRRSKFDRSTMLHAHLDNADLSGSIFITAGLGRQSRDHVDFESARFDNADLAECQFLIMDPHYGEPRPIGRHVNLFFRNTTFNRTTNVPASIRLWVDSSLVG